MQPVPEVRDRIRNWPLAKRSQVRVLLKDPVRKALSKPRPAVERPKGHLERLIRMSE
jgi:hypothetical protein